jgi:DNA polymerase III alpha subunit
MIAELHCHTSEHSSCSHVNAVELIKRAFNLGIQAVVITDHHYQWNDIDLKEIKQRAGVDDIFNVLSGQESHTSDYGHILIYGAKKTIENKAPIELFYQENINKSNKIGPDFELKVQLYKARAYLSIIYYLVKVGKGNSENFWTVLIDAERNLAHTAFRK